MDKSQVCVERGYKETRELDPRIIIEIVGPLRCICSNGFGSFRLHRCAPRAFYTLNCLIN